jgi:hypothetical protein
MITSSSELTDFIDEFRLKNSNGVVSFPATVNFAIRNIEHVITCEVQIITSNALNSIYLLLKEEGSFLPDMFTAAGNVFRYINNHCLKIKGLSPKVGEYLVSIFPSRTAKP